MGEDLDLLVTLPWSTSICRRQRPEVTSVAPRNAFRTINSRALTPVIENIVDPGRSADSPYLRIRKRVMIVCVT